MRPILFSLFGWPVPAYGVFLSLGYAAALLLVRRLSESRKLPAPRYIDASFLALASGVLGARILFVLLSPRYFLSHWASIPAFWNGGLVFYGGFLAALPALVVYFRMQRLPLAESFDLLAPALALAQGIGRIGCFFAGCCYGTTCPWGQHPVQLYESTGLFLITGLLLVLFFRRPRLRRGLVAAAYVMAYAALRFFTEFFRGDEIRGTVSGTPFSISQMIAVVLFFGGGLFLARAFRRDH